MAPSDQDNIDLYGPDDTDLYGDDDDPLMVEEEPAPSVVLPTPATSSSSSASAPGPLTSALAPLPPIPKKVIATQPVASGSGGEGAAGDVVMRPSEMPDEGKMFIGGLNWETTDESLKAYFSQFGNIDQSTIMRDPTGRSRGFAFLTYFDKESVDKVVAQSSHIVDGKVIDPKRAIPHQEHKRASKVFIGGLLASTTTDVVKEYFSQFGTVLDAQVMVDRESARSKGFGFVTFADESGCDKCLAIGMVEIEGKQVEVKRAQPRAGRDGNPAGGAVGGGGMRGPGGLPGRPGEYRPQPLMNGGMAGGMQMPMGGGGGAGMIGGFPQGGGGAMGMGGGGGMGMGMMDPAMMQQMYQRMMGGGMGMMNPQMMGQRPGMMNGAINPSFQNPQIAGGGVFNPLAGAVSPLGAAGGARPPQQQQMMNPQMMGMGMGMGGMGGMGMMNPQMMGMMGMGGMGGMGGGMGQRPMMGNMPFNPLLMQQQQQPMLQPNAGRPAGAGGRSPAAGGAVGGAAGAGGAAAGAAGGAAGGGTGPARFNTKGQSHFRPY